MDRLALNKLLELETTPAALENSRVYLREHLCAFLQANENVLICFPDRGEGSVGRLMAQVVRDCGGEPVFWGPDFRWKTLLRQAFESHALTVFGPPLVVFGLMKMAKITATPLNIHNALIGGYPFASWVIEGIKRGLDCRIWGCYLIDDAPVIAGVTCDKEAGIHIRNDLFEARITAPNGDRMADAQRGYLTLHYRPQEEIVFDSEETAKIWHQPCSCGCDDPRIVDTIYVGGNDAGKLLLEERFLDWSSVLDYRVTKGPQGDHLELVVFPGRILPRIRSDVSISVRCWDPDTDEPFCMEKYKNSVDISH